MKFLTKDMKFLLNDMKSLTKDMNFLTKDTKFLTKPMKYIYLEWNPFYCTILKLRSEQHKKKESNCNKKKIKLEQPNWKSSFIPSLKKEDRKIRCTNGSNLNIHPPAAIIDLYTSNFPCRLMRLVSKNVYIIKKSTSNQLHSNFTANWRWRTLKIRSALDFYQINFQLRLWSLSKANFLKARVISCYQRPWYPAKGAEGTKPPYVVTKPLCVFGERPAFNLHGEIRGRRFQFVALCTASIIPRRIALISPDCRRRAPNSWGEHLQVL